MSSMNIVHGIQGASHAGRHGRRKAATRAALIQAGQQLIAEGRTDVSIATITELADVGFGSFYNHFKTKDQLFEAAFAEAMEGFGHGLGRLVEDVDDMARAVSIGFRVIIRVARAKPGFASLVTRSGSAALQFDGALRRTSLHCIGRGIDSGRFSMPGPETAFAAIGGSLLGVVTYLLGDPMSDTDELVDSLAAGVLRMLGLPDEEARSIAHEDLPEGVPEEYR